MTERFVVSPGDIPRGNVRIDKLLARLMPDVSRGVVQSWLKEGRVTVDGAPSGLRQLVGVGTVLEVTPGEAPLSRAEPDPTVAFEVVYEDEHLVVVNKPAGLVVHPARGHATGTLVNGLLARGGFRAEAADPRDPAGHLRPGIVHRLDKDTSGLLVVAKDDVTREGLKAQLGARTVERRYLAFTCGVPKLAFVETTHGRHPTDRLRFTSLLREGKRAVTHVEVLERFASDRAARVACRLETGRTHQIRVHLAEQTRTPVLADTLYGATLPPGSLRDLSLGLGRQALHAETLGFVHPRTGETLRFTAALPEDMVRTLHGLRGLR